MAMSTVLVPARCERDFACARALFVEYADQLGFDLCFQGFDAELNALATMYGPPSGWLSLARHGDEYVGCVGVRRFSADECEMKRLYVRSSVRGHGIGFRLAQAAIDAARAIGYRRMLLDTLGTMVAARKMYVALGFVEIPAYYNNPMAGVAYMALDLSA